MCGQTPASKALLARPHNRLALGKRPGTPLAAQSAPPWSVNRASNATSFPAGYLCN